SGRRAGRAARAQALSGIASDAPKREGRTDCPSALHPTAAVRAQGGGVPTSVLTRIASRPKSWKTAPAPAPAQEMVTLAALPLGTFTALTSASVSTPAAVPT